MIFAENYLPELIHLKRNPSALPRQELARRNSACCPLIDGETSENHSEAGTGQAFSAVPLMQTLGRVHRAEDGRSCEIGPLLQTARRRWSPQYNHGKVPLIGRGIDQLPESFAVWLEQNMESRYDAPNTVRQCNNKIGQTVKG